MTYTIAPADLHDDHDVMVGLWARNLPEATPARYHWLYGHGRATGWIARSEDGQPVGSTGLMRRTMKVLNETVTGGQAIDLNVDCQHRSLGPALALQRAVTGSVVDGDPRLLYALPNQQSEPVLRRAGYRVFGQLRRWVKPLRSEPLLESRLRSTVVRKPVAAAIDSLLKLRSRETWMRRPRALHIEHTGWFDPRFDDLWHAAGADLPVAGERTAVYLNWRWCHAPGLTHRILSLCDQDRQLLAYLVYSHHGSTVYLDDFLFLDAHHFECLLAELVRLARRQRAEAVVTVYLGSPRAEAVLARLGFWQRPGAWNALIFVDPRGRFGHAERLYNPANWHLTRADLDTDFHSGPPADRLSPAVSVVSA